VIQLAGICDAVLLYSLTGAQIISGEERAKS
jgi:hypothetical protein